MKVGGKHNWSYRTRFQERKVAPGKWRYRYKGVKNQKAMPGVKKGSRYHWTRFEHQYATKLRSGRYLIKGYGQKRLVRARVKK